MVGAIVHFSGYSANANTAGQHLQQLVSLGVVSVPDNWQAWLAAGGYTWQEISQQVTSEQSLPALTQQVMHTTGARLNAENLQDFMLSLHFYFWLLKLRFTYLVPHLVLLVPMVVALWYSLRCYRHIGEHNLRYVSPLRKQISLYTWGISTWLVMVLLALPLHLPLGLVTLGICLMLLSAYDLRKIVQVSRKTTTITPV
ncbi:hypothetical protein CKF58_03775 [Psittacicella hinzii]|uniref:DUF4400 domain-containing protein n=1 Tax=Psittacicella hinzii TaxID=2028575 RepID=A0A3A1YK36_9GAMM|nr:hypothetical protein CKF58_03775 [Psittacicella hinzii]